MLEVPEALAALEQISGLLESITIAVADAGSAISAPQKAEADRSEDAVHTQAAFL